MLRAARADDLLVGRAPVRGTACHLTRRRPESRGADDLVSRLASGVCRSCEGIRPTRRWRVLPGVPLRLRHPGLVRDDISQLRTIR
jgi:hypothetical protein